MIDLLNKEEILKTNFPQDKIILLSGKELTCYPCADNNNKDYKYGTEKNKEDEKFFMEHAYFFLDHADAIFNDSRMFLAAAPAYNGLAYTGGSNLRHATLGVYLEWWIYGEEWNKKDTDGNDAITCVISGSPLSGGNACYGVYPDGSMKTIRHTHFSYLWRSFSCVNSRYREAHFSYDSYSLREVYDILMTAEQDEASMLRTKLIINEGRVASLTTKLLHVTESYNDLSEKYKQLCVLHSQAKLKQFSDDFNKCAEEVANQIADLDNQHKALKVRLKKGELTQVEYQKLLHPINHQRDELEHNLWQYGNDQTRKLINEEGHITDNMVRCYLREHATETSARFLRF